MQQPTTVTLGNLTDHLQGQDLHQVLHPQVWSPVFLRALKIRLIEKVTGAWFLYGAPDSILEKPELIELTEGIRGVKKPYGDVDNHRTSQIDFIVALGVILETCTEARHAEHFVAFVIKYLTDYVLLSSHKCIIDNYHGWDTPVNLWLRFKGLRRFFNPAIAVSCSSNRAPVLTVVTPSALHGNPNCQIVGYLLAIAQKGFRIRRQRFEERPYLVRLAAGSRAWFAKIAVSRKYLDTLENGTIAEDEEGFGVEITDVYDLKDADQRAAFVTALTCVYAKSLKYENLLHRSYY
ncbi:hypothetical protein L873DRAFT_1740165 [Choiromyces venosus 120613-1]|uniref:Uncharacterized protein n=1 Tax=Choiromyces venosus 120613-1 TaxID=1336337 RepID=A0A3N4JJR4_9PEZI|nr:hypothetical protein L873DRAFT_1740165 [Choiromyces venosus 120613-1]